MDWRKIFSGKILATLYKDYDYKLILNLDNMIYLFNLNDNNYFCRNIEEDEINSLIIVDKLSNYTINMNCLDNQFLLKIIQMECNQYIGEKINLELIKSIKNNINDILYIINQNLITIKYPNIIFMDLFLTIKNYYIVNDNFNIEICIFFSNNITQYTSVISIDLFNFSISEYFNNV